MDGRVVDDQRMTIYIVALVTTHGSWYAPTVSYSSLARTATDV
jgi:hypothetical protein